MSEVSTKPYLIRAIYEWCSDSGLTPYISVKINSRTRVPMEFARNGEIVLNIAHDATRGLVLENDFIRFSARFGGVSRDVIIPVEAVAGVFAKENSQGLFFQVEEESREILPDDEPPLPPSGGKPRLTIVK